MAIRGWRYGDHTPHPRTRRRLADALEQDIATLFPDERRRPSDEADLVTAYAHRTMAPKDLWRRFLAEADDRVDMAAYAMQFLPEDVHDFCDLLAAVAEAGRVRVVLADPGSPLVAARDEEEGLAGQLAHRIRTTLRHLRPLSGRPGVELRYQHAPMYNSTFLTGQRALFTPHIYGQSGYLSPLFDVRRRVDKGLYDNLAAGFERLWTNSQEVADW